MRIQAQQFGGVRPCLGSAFLLQILTSVADSFAHWTLRDLSTEWKLSSLSSSDEEIWSWNVMKSCDRHNPSQSTEVLFLKHCETPSLVDRNFQILPPHSWSRPAFAMTWCRSVTLHQVRQVRRLGIWIWWDMMEYDDMGIKVKHIGPQMEKEMDQLVPHSLGFPEWVIVLVVWLHPLRAPWDTRIPTCPNSQMFWERLEWCAYLQLKLGCFFPPLHLLERLFQGVFQSAVNNRFLRLILIICWHWSDFELWHFFIFQFWPRRRKIRDVLGIALGHWSWFMWSTCQELWKRTWTEWETARVAHCLFRCPPKKKTKKELMLLMLK